MSQTLIEAATQSEAPPRFHSFSVTPATVLENIDETGQMRVQVRIAWLPDVDPWVRVAVPMAGPQRGTFFIPQQDDEVLVAFNHGDFKDSYVIGSLWNGEDDPPADDPTDAIKKRLIRSTKGLELRFDDEQPVMVLTLKPPSKKSVGPISVDASDAASSGEDDDQKNIIPVVSIDKDKIVIKRVSNKEDGDEDQVITIDDDGITLEVKKGDIVLKATEGKLVIDAKQIQVKSSAQTKIVAKGTCTIKGRQIKLN